MREPLVPPLRSQYSCGFLSLQLSAIFLASIPAGASAQTAAREAFEYSPPGGTLLDLDGGSGFTGPWFSSGFNATLHENYIVADGSLPFRGLGTPGNRVQSAAVPAIAGLGRNLAVPIAAGTTTTIYFSLLLRPEGTLGAGVFNGFFGAYLDGTGNGGNADLFVGKPGSDVVGSWVIEGRGGSGQVASGVAPAVGETTLLVVRADLQPGPDLFTLYVNPGPCEPEPSLGVLKSDLDLGDVTALVIYSSGAFSLDELRLGASFEGVLPCAVSEPIDYAPAGSALIGLDGGSGFVGPWSASGFNATLHDNYVVADGSLPFRGLETTGNRVRSGPTAAIAGLGRNLAVPIAAGTTTTIYFSLLLRPEGTLGEGVFNGFFGAYLDGTGNAGNADLFVGKPGSDVVGSWVIEDRGGSGQVASGVAPAVDDTTLLVVRADLQPGPDLFTLYVNPDPCEPEPSLGVLKSDLDLGDVTALVIYSSGAFSLDELRLGASFEGVVKGDGAACPVGGAQLPSDCNQDGTLDLSDGVCLLNFLFQGTLRRLPCGDETASDPGNLALLDANGDLKIDISDAVRVFGFLFLGQAPPVLGTECAAIAGCPTGPTCEP